MNAKTDAYNEIFKLSKETNNPVTVVPIFAPIIIEVAWARVIAPALTKPIAMTVVAALDCINAVTPAPIPTPANRLFVILPISFFIPGPATFCKASDIIFIPMTNTPTPASKANILWNICIRSSSFLLIIIVT